MLLACRPALQHHGLGRKVRNRLPLHLSMTEAVRHKFMLLDQQYTRTLQQQQQQQKPLRHHSLAAEGRIGSCSPTTATPCRSTAHAGSTTAGQLAGEGSWVAAEQAAVAPQLLTVTVQGRVLSKEHIKAGSYIPPPEQAEALKLLAGEVLTVVHSVGV